MSPKSILASLSMRLRLPSSLRSSAAMAAEGFLGDLGLNADALHGAFAFEALVREAALVA